MTNPADELATVKAELANARDLIVRLYAEVEALKVELYLAKVEGEKSHSTGFDDAGATTRYLKQVEHCPTK